jgi:putative transposase
LSQELQAQGVSQRQACVLAGLARSSGRYVSAGREDTEVIRALQEHSAGHPREGYRKARIRICRQLGRRVNHKKVQRLWRELGLAVPRRRRRRRRGKSAPAPRRACYPRQVWTYDFVQDSCIQGRILRFLTIVDEFTRECFGVAVRRSFKAEQVVAVLRELFQRQGAPKYLRSDNGPEFIAQAVQGWLRDQQVQTLYIEPGQPWQNGFIESFNASFRAECLDLEVFLNLTDAAGIAERYRQYYNQARPHGGLGYRTPLAFQQEWLTAAGALPPHPRSLALGDPPECWAGLERQGPVPKEKPCLGHGHSVRVPAPALGSLSSGALSSEAGVEI